MTRRDPLAFAHKLAFFLSAADRKGKPADPGHVWCYECGMQQVSTDVGDLCPPCAERLNRLERASHQG